MFRKTMIAGLTAAAFGSGLAQAQQPAAAPASPHTLTGNVGLYSQYVFRGMKQTAGDPAVQGGFDYSHASGFYAGTWASNISWLKENFTANVPPIVTGGQYSSGGSLEWDFYGGYKWSFAPDWTLDVGGLYYWYPGDVAATIPVVGGTAACTYGTLTCPRADTFELYAGLSWKWVSAKYSHSMLKHTFGLPNSRNTYYLDLSASVPLGDLAKDLTGWTLIAHWGKQKYDGQIPGVVINGVLTNNDTLASYEDWKLGLSYALPKDFTIGAYYTDISGANRLYYGSVAEGGPYPKSMAKGTGTVFISKTF